MRKFLKLGIVFALAAAAGPVAAKERLVLEPYPATPAWRQVTQEASGDQFLWEFLPEGQTFDSYQAMLTAQSFPGAQRSSPSDFLAGIFKQAVRQCKGLRVNGPKAAEQDGAQIAYAQVYCGVQKGKSDGANIFYKAIQGADAMYVVNVEMRVPASKMGGVQTFSPDQMQAFVAQMKVQAEADRYLVDQVYLCADGSEKSACAPPPE